ncbi:MAG: 16S rRNA (cytidine(1402)-2'-O)-methyltransferase [Dokdonella sp.]|uniref:16S rRNA (cytidine(1402)-2'-O)-methyltransferase n=1 Tax=Dokdonella sp. TaxID=2291710 RepID=UPI002C00461C|nr:16S rRNA (cytidine(1402)-2'-O)-methyltransferase [Dokdonella sp.]HOX70955.1 16S rRNA (cytidine(1402)-2'-O)-methyltransferase [Dokdonella sp.]HPG93361.1 16S rRNA (cytidine(1402)-2'-O)-methyltransferase [Dokdonella sp.]HPN79009.1 16S rRNA (cytidine(1402)-2'-O)-methyltransferase [Dokdonella sp.]
MNEQAGRLWVVATPIGNLDDLSARAAEVLRGAALIAAEDTRHSGPLLARVGSRAQAVALHEHNEREQVARLVEGLRRGGDVALISDAGTPLISDPGFRLVRAAREAGIEVSPVPGPCAAIAALSVAGLPSDRFVFEGFLAAKAAARRERLGELVADTRTLIFYESSHRIVAMLDDVASVFGAERHVVVARELTKVFETVLSGSAVEILRRLHADANQQRGEFVVLVAGAGGEDADATLAEGRRVFALLCEELPPARAARMAAAITGAPRKQLYATSSG